MTEAEKKFKEKGEQIRNDLEKDKVKEEKAMEVAKSQLDAIRKDPDMAKMYADNAQVGSENVSGALPYLKVHSTGRSTKNELSDGTEPNNGWFFYKPTGEQFETVTCHVLTISQGYRSEGMPDKNGEKKMVFNQLVAGVIIDGADLKPFLMYITGVKLQNLWEFGKEISKYTHMKPLSIPMFALTVKLTTEQVETNFGKNWVVKFNIVKDDNGPLLISDPNEFNYLKSNVELMKETIAGLISSRSSEAGQIQTTDPEDGTVSPDDIPF